MLWAVVLLLALLPPGSQMSSGLEGGMMSIARKHGSYVVITCDVLEENNYIHWYLFKAGQPPHHLLYYDFFASKAVVDFGLNPAKYHAYEVTKNSYKFVLRKVEESDSGYTVKEPPPYFRTPVSLYSEKRETLSAPPNSTLISMSHHSPQLYPDPTHLYRTPLKAPLPSSELGQAIWLAASTERNTQATV
ncbi:T-cell receptor gamma chain V region PT-gamma-1/2 [Fukomys damarensis]|nr:T-cell receptor gamma chain V region PT-gamma-1/2 [Fukomys damarensis]